MADNILTADEYIMYLRKSRADNPHESVEEVLESTNHSCRSLQNVTLEVASRSIAFSGKWFPVKRLRNARSSTSFFR